MWKILTIIAAVALVGAGVLGYQNKVDYEMEIGLRQDAQKRLAETEERLASTKVDLTKTEDELATVKQKVVSLKAELAKVEVSTSEAEKKSGELEDELGEIIVKIAAMKDAIDLIGPIEEIKSKMDQLSTDLAATKQQILSAENALNIARQERANRQATIDQYVAQQRDQRNGVIRTHLNASVSGAYVDWGFVVINAGNRQGVVPKAELAVARQGMQICRLLVTNVDPGSSVASIVPGSMAPGQVVLPGDRVVVVPPTATES